MVVGSLYLTKDCSPDDYEPYIKEEVKGVRVLRLLKPENASQDFAMRTYILDSGGHTALEFHDHEHGVYVLEGVLQAKISAELIELRPGDVVYISSNEPHQFLNPWPQSAKFLCVRNFPKPTS